MPATVTMARKRWYLVPKDGEHAHLLTLRLCHGTGAGTGTIKESNHPAVDPIRNVKEAWQEDLMDQFVRSSRRANRTKSRMESETKAGIECCVAC